MIRWDVTPEDQELILKLAKMAVDLIGVVNASHPTKPPILYPFQDAVMDLTATHANGCPLYLLDMVEAGPKDPDVIHDLLGIRRHLDRRTGQLKDCFVPRFADLRKLG